MCAKHCNVMFYKEIRARNRICTLRFLISCTEWAYFELNKRAAWDRLFDNPVMLKSKTSCLTEP